MDLWARQAHRTGVMRGVEVAAARAERGPQGESEALVRCREVLGQQRALLERMEALRVKPRAIVQSIEHAREIIVGLERTIAALEVM